MIANFLKFFFGTANQRILKQVQPIINKINELESKVIHLDDIQLQMKTEEFKSRIELGESLDSILPEAFAVVRESAKRILGQRHYDVQLIGGIILHQGKIAEMKTGEGKTLTSTLPLYLNALSGKNVQLITVNDYLAKRDSAWMGQVFKKLGITTGCIQNTMMDDERRIQYECDITYGTNSEFGFDYLRDNMKFRLEDYIQRDLYYAIIDEVDSILIDEARTPLIISGSTKEEITLYKTVNDIIKHFKSGTDFSIDEKEKNVTLMDEGTDKIEAAFKISNLYALEHIQLLHHVNQSLKAHAIFKKDVDYVNWENEILIVDEFTGRVLPGRRYSDGLHQAIEAKENAKIREESQTLASITLQNYFRMYKKLAGMTGTALTEAEEFHKIYNLDVVSIPTNKPMQRVDKNDLIFFNEKSKFKNIVEDIKLRHEKGQPVLIGTVAIETSEKISHELSRAGIPHEVLNAKQHAREADIIEHAGEKGKITIATNMAGRGTDIKLTPEAKDAGGLYILGTERHESRRIDNQLRGRSGRQGDQGESRFYISLDDSLVKRFGGENLKLWMTRSGMTEDEIIEDSLISSTIEMAQQKVEKHNFEIRKYLIEYDNVLNQQRLVIYGLRKNIIKGGVEVINSTHMFLNKFISYMIDKHIKHDSDLYQNLPEFFNDIEKILQINVKEKLSCASKTYRSILSLKEDLHNELIQIYTELLEKNSQMLKDITPEEAQNSILEAQKWFMLETLDQAWRQHIVNLENLREGVGLRSYGQKTPIIEYKKEAFSLFGNMIAGLTIEIVSRLCSIDFNDFNQEQLELRRLNELKEIAESLLLEQGGDKPSLKKSKNKNR